MMSMNENEFNELYPALRTEESRAKFASDMSMICGHVLTSERLADTLTKHTRRAFKRFDEYARVLHSALSDGDELAGLYREAENVMDSLSVGESECVHINKLLTSLSVNMQYISGCLSIRTDKLAEIHDLIQEWEALRFADRVQNLLETLSDYGQVMKSVNRYVRSLDDEDPLVSEHVADACKSVNMTMPDPVLYAAVAGFLEDARSSAENLNREYFS